MPFRKARINERTIDQILISSRLLYFPCRYPLHYPCIQICEISWVKGFIPERKYQVKPRPSSWFSPACYSPNESLLPAVAERYVLLQQMSLCFYS